MWRRTGFMGFLSHLFPVSPSLPTPTATGVRAADSPDGRANEGSPSPKTWSASSCQSSPAASLPRSAAKKVYLMIIWACFVTCGRTDGKGRDGSGNSLQSYERAELNLAAGKSKRTFRGGKSKRGGRGGALKYSPPHWDYCRARYHAMHASNAVGSRRASE